MKQQQTSIKVIRFSLLCFLVLNIACSSKGYLNKSNFVEAKFPFGQDSLQTFIKRNVVWQDKMVGGPGTVYLSFIVDKKGNHKKVKIMHSNLWKSFDNEAIRLVNLMPKWIPAQRNGKNVCSKVKLPIRFKIED